MRLNPKCTAITLETIEKSEYYEIIKQLTDKGHFCLVRYDPMKPVNSPDIIMIASFINLHSLFDFLNITVAITSSIEIIYPSDYQTYKERFK